MKNHHTQQLQSPAITTRINPQQKRNTDFFRLTFKDLLTILFSAILPIAVAIHTLIVTRAEAQRANELRQQHIYDEFLSNIYKLHVDQELSETAKPWAFANARYRSAHRQWDLIRKQQSIQFLKEKELIGRHEFQIKNGKLHVGCQPDIIRMKELNLNNMVFESSSKNVYKVNMSCIHFEKDSLKHVRFSDVHLDFAVFEDSHLNDAQFISSSLQHVTIINSTMDMVDFSDSDITNVQFINIDLSTVKLSSKQVLQARFYNVVMPNGTRIGTDTIPNLHHQGLLASTTSMSTYNTLSIMFCNNSYWNDSTSNFQQESNSSSTTYYPYNAYGPNLTATTYDVTSMKIEIRNTSRLPEIPINATWSENGTTIISDLNSPWGLAVNQADGTVFVADYSNHRVVAWNPSRNETREIVTNLRYPKDIMVHEESNSIIIADQGNKRILRWSLENGTTREETMIDNITCHGLAIDYEGNLYVSDEENHEVRKYIYGQKMSILATGRNVSGNQSYQLSNPTSIALDNDGAVYVSDNNHRVMKWIKGAAEWIIVAGGNEQGSNNNQLNYPEGILVDSNGNLYIVDYGNDRLSRWRRGEKEGEILVGGKGRGNGKNQLNWPTSLSFDRDNNLYVVDSNNNRVQRFSINNGTF